MERRYTPSRKLQSIVTLGVLGCALVSNDNQSTHNQTFETATTTEIVAAAPAPEPTTSFNTAFIEKAWNAALANHTGEIDIAINDFQSNQIAHTHYPKDSNSNTFDTASIVKLSTLENLLIKSQLDQEPITPYENDLAARMIENSDNNATAILWNEIGDAPAMDSFWQQQLGTTATTAGTNGYWGNTQTTAIDQLKVVNAVVNAGTILSPLTKESGAYADELMRNVEPDQHWGISGGIPENIPVNLKNGWFPDSFTTNNYSDTNSWTINSIGYIPNHYSIAILTRGNRSMEDGIALVEKLSAIAWKCTQHITLAPKPSKP
ncbi:serine hydrolase [Candidatus Saccharibacteria bacterium]|nr:serine hydrolase [Candidatus Saccharibacteria bacterium]